MATVKVVGLSETLRELQKMDKEMVKQIRKDFRQIAKPAIKDIRFFMPDREPLTGMRKGRLQFDPKRADSRVGAYVRPYKKRRKSANVETHSLFNIEERDPGGSIFDIAGRKSNGGNKARRKTKNGAIKIVTFEQTFIENLQRNPKTSGRYANKQASRAMWPGAEKGLPDMANQVQDAVNKRIAKYNKEVRTV